MKREEEVEGGGGEKGVKKYGEIRKGLWKCLLGIGIHVIMITLKNEK